MEIKNTDGWIESALQLVLPSKCFCCGIRVSIRKFICATCKRDLVDCIVPEDELPGMTPAGRRVVAAFYYRKDSPVRIMHRAAKYKAHTWAAQCLGILLGNRLIQLSCTRDLPIAIDACVPLPSHRSRILGRGMDSTYVLGRHVAKKLKVACRTDILTRERLSSSQSDVSGEERRENVSGVFQAVKVDGRNVLLVDDVMTTGATLDEAASTLEAVGYDVTLMALAFRREMFARPDYRKSSTST